MLRFLLPYIWREPAAIELIRFRGMLAIPSEGESFAITERIIKEGLRHRCMNLFGTGNRPMAKKLGLNLVLTDINSVHTVQCSTV